MQHSVYTAKNITVGIGPTFTIKDGEKTENKIYCTLYNCTIGITGANNAENALIKCMSLTMDYTEVKAQCGKYYKAPASSDAEPAYNYCIRTDMINVFQSDIDLKGTQGGISRLIFFESAFLLKYSILSCEGYGCPAGITIGNHYSAIHGNGDTAVMNAECSSITVKFTGYRDDDTTYGIDCNFIMYHSDVDVNCTMGEAFNITDTKNVYIDDSIIGLQGSDDGIRFVDITDPEQIGEYKIIRAVSERLAYFDLNGGTGSPVGTIEGLSAGQEITLPECNAKRGDLVFIGWDDGEKLYQPGDKYVVTYSTYFTAVYGEDHSGTTIE